MWNARFKKLVFSGLLSAAALFGAASPAQAVIYVGNFDPAFGSIFPNLGFRGTATFNLPTACDGLTGTFSNTAPSCGGGLMQITSASVDLYDLATPTAVLQTLNFATPGTILSVSLFTPATFGPPAQTQLTGVNSSFSNGVVGTISQTQIGQFSYRFYLGFSGNTATLAYARGEVSPQLCSRTAPNDNICGFSETSPTVTFTPPVPEPETYGLMLAGLIGLSLVTRGRRVR